MMTNQKNWFLSRGIDLTIPTGQYLAIMGSSGSGKSTLMNLLGCLDRPTSGSYRLEGLDVSTLDDTSLSQARGRRIGFVFQSFNLVPTLTARENITLPVDIAGRDIDTEFPPPGFKDWNDVLRVGGEGVGEWWRKVA